jgi:hypothetical protein
MRLDIIDDAMELIERFRGLGVKIDVMREIKTFHLVETLYHNGCTLGLPYKSQDLSMPLLAEDDNLRR